MQKMPAPLRFIPPMECLKVDRIPEGNLWQYELKLDGYRTLAIKEDRDVHLFSRNGASFNSKFPSMVKALERLRIKRFILGEMVALDERGRLLAQRQRRINKRLAMVLRWPPGLRFSWSSLSRSARTDRR
jgi:bifunctional non-homologous end joining protein LigD